MVNVKNITAEEFEQIPCKGPNYNTPLHKDESDLPYGESHREREASMSLGNPWQNIDFENKYITKTQHTLNQWKKTEERLHNRTLMITGKVSPKTTNRMYMVVEDIEGNYISDLENGEFNNPYYRIFPHKHNPNRVEYLGSNQFPDIGSDKVLRKHTDNISTYMGSPSYIYGVDRLLSVNIKGYTVGQKGVTNMELQIRAPKGNPMKFFKDVQIVKLHMQNGNKLLLLPIVKYNGYWIYDSYNRNEQFLKKVGKKRRNTYRKWEKVPRFDENGMFRHGTEVFAQTEEIARVEYVQIRINSGRYHVMTEQMFKTLQRKINELQDRIWSNQNIEPVIPKETEIKMMYVLDSLCDELEEIVA